MITSFSLMFFLIPLSLIVLFVLLLVVQVVVQYAVFLYAMMCKTTEESLEAEPSHLIRNSPGLRKDCSICTGREKMSFNCEETASVSNFNVSTCILEPRKPNAENHFND